MSDETRTTTGFSVHIGAGSEFTTAYLFPGPLDRSRLVPFYCHQCKAWYVKVNPNVSCLVMHHGECCHYQDERCETPDWDGPLARVEWRSDA